MNEILRFGNEQYYLYGNCAYVLLPYIQILFPKIGAPEQQLSYILATIKVRAVVKWL